MSRQDFPMIHCKDCQHFDYARGGEYCRQPRTDSDPPDYTGTGTTPTRFAAVERRSELSHRCGPDAKHFQPKQP